MARPHTPERRHTPERMDEPGVDRAELDAALRFIRGVNRWLGGSAALLGPLRSWSRSWPAGRPVRLLDIATGSADLPIAVRAWALSAGIDLRIVAIDAHETTLSLAAEHLARQPAAVRAGVELIRLDAFGVRGRFGDGAFDYAHAGLFLHHLEDDGRVRTMLEQMDAVARHGVVWNDLIRGRLARAGVRALTALAGPMVRHDARVSVDAGFTRGEAEDLARRAGLGYLRWSGSIRTQRFVMAGQKPGAWR